MKKLVSLLFHRAVLMGVFLLIQIAVLVLMLLRFNEFFLPFYGVCVALSIVAVFWIVNRSSEPAYKIAWIVPILIFPIFGGLFYLLFGGNKLSRRTRRKMEGLDRKMEEVLGPDFKADSLACVGEDAVHQARYLEHMAHCPVYSGTATEYYPVGELCFARMVEELKKAEHYIFVEYFIIEEGIMWDTILDILKEKVQEGLDVRVIYDDIGSMFKVPTNYAEMLEKEGIPCLCFNRFRPVLDVAQNNRTHRKIAVIDGRVAFTGGINLADEYINETHPFGHWKDTGLLFEGRAVQNMTALFLQTWALKGEEADTSRYLSQAPSGKPCLCFGDSPFDGDRNLCEDLYLRLIYNAKKYVYIYTPYLIPDEEMKRALITAARSGVDVRILVPHIPDKKYVFAVTKAFAVQLTKQGIKVYRYTPGFVHAKSIVADGKYCVIGSSNIDFRSFYLHFENNMMFFDEVMSGAIERDFLDACEKSALITPKLKDNWLKALCRAILRYFAPLM